MPQLPNENKSEVQGVDSAARNIPAGQKANPKQDDYDIFVSQGIMLAGPASEKLQGRASVDGLGNSLFEIVKKVESAGKQNGVEFSLDVILNGSSEILNKLIAMSGVQLNDEQIKAVIGTAVGQYVKDALNTGKWTPQQAQQIAQQAQAAVPQPGQGGMPGGMPAAPAGAGMLAGGPGPGGIV